MTEYGLLAGLVAVTAIGAVGGAGERVRDVFTQTGTALKDTSGNGAQGGATQTPEPTTNPRADENCYDPINIETIGQSDWAGCEGMLIVSNALLRGAASANADPNGGYASSGDDPGPFEIEGPDGRDYTFADSARNVFTGQVTDMSHLFRDTSFDGDIGYWDVSEVTDMTDTFYNATSFNHDLSGWDVSNVKDMSAMFGGADAFNQGLSEWDVSGVTDMGGMFSGADVFNQDLSGWDVSGVTDMGSMFISAVAFDQDLSEWDVAAVSDCEYFSYNAPSWSKPEPSFGDCS